MGSYALLYVRLSVRLSLDQNYKKKFISWEPFDQEVKGHKYQGQRSHGSRSNKDPKQRQVGSQQRQVASFNNTLLNALLHQISLSHPKIGTKKCFPVKLP